MEPLFPTPLSKHIPMFAIAFGLTWLWSNLNARNFKPLESMTPEFKNKENVITRTDAPPVFINPITRGLPGNILGPEDLEKLE